MRDNGNCCQESHTCCNCCAAPSDGIKTGLAVDLTHDPKNGIDCAEIFENLKTDKRVKYLIYNKKIWSRERSGEGNRNYTGSNPHTKHIHISIEEKHSKDTSPWFSWMETVTYTTVDQARAMALKLKPLPKKKESK